jgi:ABC-type nitrate/sulfonate/bicarbonate transport system substrate-binding protein
MLQSSKAVISRGLARLAAIALAFAFAHAALGQSGKPLKKVTIAAGTQVLNIAYPWLMMPQALNYWRDEGYDVQVIVGQSSLQSIQLLAAGNADFAQVNSGPLVQAAVMNQVPLRTVMVNGVVDWSLVVPQASAVKSVSDFKGKAIGVSTLGTGGVALLQSYLRTNGVNPDADIQIIPVGFGPLALQALRSDKVQGLMYWASAVASFENAGEKLRYFVAPEWRKYPDFSLVALQSTIAKDPAMVEAVVRGAAKASEFSVANPDCVRQLQWKHWPSSKPTGGDDATLAKRDLHYLNAQLDSMKKAMDLAGGKLWGRASGAEFAPFEAFLLSTKIIDKKLPNPDDYVIGVPGFFERANTFDHAAVRAQAKACTL